jgi:hypothetical protein
VPESGQVPGPVRNPLWIISAFLGLAEATAGLAATATDGWIQGMFAIFAVVMPTMVVGLFFRILVTRPHVLYAPGDFSQTTPSVDEFAQAMTAYQSQTVEYRALVAASARKVVAREVDMHTARSDAGRAKEEAVVALDEAIREEVVSINLSAFERAGIEFVVKEGSTVTDLLDYVYFSISNHVRAYRYGEEWVLRDVKRDKMVVKRSNGPGGAQLPRGASDLRLLSEVGIGPGTVLEAVRL